MDRGFSLGSAPVESASTSLRNFNLFHYRQEDLRRQKWAFTNKDSNVDIHIFFSLSKQAWKAVIQTLPQGIGLCWVVQRDNRKNAVDVKGNKIPFSHRLLWLMIENEKALFLCSNFCHCNFLTGPKVSFTLWACSNVFNYRARLGFDLPPRRILLDMTLKDVVMGSWFMAFIYSFKLFIQQREYLNVPWGLN